MNEEIIRLNRAIVIAEAWGFYHYAKALRKLLAKVFEGMRKETP